MQYELWWECGREMWSWQQDEHLCSWELDDLCGSRISDNWTTWQMAVSRMYIVSLVLFH